MVDSSESEVEAIYFEWDVEGVASEHCLVSCGEFTSLSYRPLPASALSPLIAITYFCVHAMVICVFSTGLKCLTISLTI